MLQLALCLLLAVGAHAMSVVNANRYWLAPLSTAFGSTAQFPTGGVARVKDNPADWATPSDPMAGVAYNDRLNAICLQADPECQWRQERRLCAGAYIGTGADGAVRVWADVAGVGGIIYAVEVLEGVGNNVPLSAAWSGNVAQVTLATDGAGALDPAQNEAGMVAAVLDALADISAEALGTGTDPLLGAEGPTTFDNGAEATAGTWGECVPPGETVTFLRNRDSTADQGAIAIAATECAVTANPCVSARIYRAARAAGSTQEGCITVGLAEDPLGAAQYWASVMIWDSRIICQYSNDGINYVERAIQLTPEQAAKIIGPCRIDLDMWFCGGRWFTFIGPLDVLVTLRPEDNSALPVILPVLTQWQVTAQASGAFAVNVSQVTFATSGTFCTPPIEHLVDVSPISYALPTTAGSTLRPFPPLPAAPCDIAVSAPTIVDTTARYPVTLTGDGYSPCPLQALSVEYAADWDDAPRPEFWLDTGHDISVLLPGVNGATETYPEDGLQRSGTLMLDVSQAATYATLRSRCLAVFSDEEAFRQYNAVVYEIGPAGSRVVRMIGVVKDVQEDATFAGQHLLRYTVGGRGTVWADMSAVTCPALWGLSLSAAVKLLCERAGVWCNAGGDLDVSGAPAATVADPGWGYGDDPAGDYTGGSILEALQKLLADYGAILQDRDDGILYLIAKPTAGGGLPRITGDKGDAGSEAEKTWSITARYPYAAQYNGVLVKGKAPGGAILQKYLPFVASPIPYQCVQIVDHGDAAPTQARVDALAATALADLSAGRREVVAVNRGGGWYDWYSRSFVEVTDTALDLSAAVHEIVNVEINFEEGLRIMPVTLTLREEA